MRKILILLCISGIWACAPQLGQDDLPEARIISEGRYVAQNLGFDAQVLGYHDGLFLLLDPNTQAFSTMDQKGVLRPLLDAHGEGPGAYGAVSHAGWWAKDTLLLLDDTHFRWYVGGQLVKDRLREEAGRIIPVGYPVLFRSSDQVCFPAVTGDYMWDDPEFFKHTFNMACFDVRSDSIRVFGSFPPSSVYRQLPPFPSLFYANASFGPDGRCWLGFPYEPSVVAYDDVGATAREVPLQAEHFPLLNRAKLAADDFAGQLLLIQKNAYYAGHCVAGDTLLTLYKLPVPEAAMANNLAEYNTEAAQGRPAYLSVYSTAGTKLCRDLDFGGEFGPSAYLLPFADAQGRFLIVDNVDEQGQEALVIHAIRIKVD